MAKQLYAPLVFIEKCNKYGGYSEKNLKDNYYDHLLKDVIHIPKDKLPSIDWIIKYALSNKFMKSCKRHAEECMDDICHTELIIQHGLGDFIDVECMKLAVQILTSSKEVSVNNANVIRAEMRDLFVQPNFFGKWARNKQVLKPDTVFLKYLLDTKELVTKHGFFDYLPFSTFYIDLEGANKEVPDFGNVAGVFVDIIKLSEKEAAIAIVVLTDDFQPCSFYWNFPIDEDVKISIENLPGVPTAVESVKVNFNFCTIVITVIQMLSYLKVREPDINAAPEMKYTYKPHKHGDRITNGYNEVYKQEVGVRIGKKISTNIKEMKKAEKKEQAIAASHGHKSPIPHFRSAHWHGYWYGHGDDKKLEYKWIEPVFVCGSYSSDKNSDVVIHKVEE